MYTCVASNEMGQDQTAAPVAVETRQSRTGYQELKSVGHAMRSARRSHTRALATETREVVDEDPMSQSMIVERRSEK